MLTTQNSRGASDASRPSPRSKNGAQPVPPTDRAGQMTDARLGGEINFGPPPWLAREPKLRAIGLDQLVEDSFSEHWQFGI